MQRQTRRIGVTVLGQRYVLRVGHGLRHEERARAAARLVQQHAERLRGATGEVDGRHLAVMAAVAIADELLEAREVWARERTDDAVFRTHLRDRATRLLGLVEAELADADPASRPEQAPTDTRSNTDSPAGPVIGP